MGFKGKVLVVDDDEDLLGLVSYALSRAGYEVFTAVRGDEGAAAAVPGGFDLVVLDMMLPGMDGVTVLGKIKKSAPFTEVIMLTAHSSVDTAVECMRMGAFDYIRKPFRIEDLEAVAGKAVEKRRLGEVARAALAAGGPNGLMQAIIASALSLLGADQALVLSEKNTRGGRLLSGAAGFLPVCERGAELLPGGGGEALSVSPAGDGRFAGLHGAADTAAAMFIPLAEGGVLCALRAAGGAPFGESELRRAKSLGPIVSLAIKNSELNSQLRSVRLQLAQKQKMESLGLLTGQISHDFNNLLAVIIGSVQLLMENMRPGTGMKLSEDILNMARQSETLIKQLLLFARKDEAPVVPADLNAAVNDVKLMISMMAGKDARVDYRQDKELPNARIRPDHFKQVVLNLAANAGKASRAGGAITIVTRRGLAGEDAPRGIRAEDCAVLEVSDEGPGISPENLEKVFEPFFTTRPAGQGTGLGLHIARSVLLEYGGDIIAVNRPGGGAAFRVFLPACGG